MRKNRSSVFLYMMLFVLMFPGQAVSGGKVTLLSKLTLELPQGFKWFKSRSSYFVVDDGMTSDAALVFSREDVSEIYENLDSIESNESFEFVSYREFLFKGEKAFEVKSIVKKNNWSMITIGILNHSIKIDYLGPKEQFHKFAPILDSLEFLDQSECGEVAVN